jgi:hypothetical protein
MMKKFYIKKELLIKLILLSLIFLLLLPFSIFTFWLLLIGILFFLFRRNKVEYKDSLANAADIILAPLSGQVVAIDKDADDHPRLRLSMPLIGPYGLFMPYSSEIIHEQFINGEKYWRGINGLCDKINAERNILEFKNKLGDKLKMEIYNCVLGGSAEIWLKVGDKGRASACYGLVPFGGTVVITFPKETEILVKTNDSIQAGLTILAGFKG